jgi:hypothetical protein
MTTTPALASGRGAKKRAALEPPFREESALRTLQKLA